MADSDTLYYARFQLPSHLEKGRDNLLKCPVYRNGALQAPSSGTVTVLRQDGTEVVSAAAVTITASVAEYNVTAATISGEEAGEGWLFEWALVMPDTITHTFRNDGALVLRRLYPVVVEADLYRRHADLNPSFAGSIAGPNTDYTSYLDEAWTTIESKLIAEGRRPWLAMSPAAFRDLHLYMTLELIFTDFMTSMGDSSKYEMLAMMYHQKAKDAWPKLNYVEDTDHDGKIDDHKRRRSAVSTIWLNGKNGRPDWKRSS